MTTTEPQGLMFACITVGDTAAAETAVCAEHREGFVPAPRHGDVEDQTLQDCSGVETLLCTVCERDAGEVAERASRTVWVKTTSHRARAQLRHAFERAGLVGKAQPQPWFRRPRPGSRAWIRQDGEFWEVPVKVDVSQVKGASVLKRPVLADERFRPGFGS